VNYNSGKLFVYGYVRIEHGIDPS